MSEKQEIALWLCVRKDSWDKGAEAAALDNSKYGKWVQEVRARALVGECFLCHEPCVYDPLTGEAIARQMMDSVPKVCMDCLDAHKDDMDGLDKKVEQYHAGRSVQEA